MEHELQGSGVYDQCDHEGWPDPLCEPHGRGKPQPYVAGGPQHGVHLHLELGRLLSCVEAVRAGRLREGELDVVVPARAVVAHLVGLEARIGAELREAALALGAQGVRADGRPPAVDGREASARTERRSCRVRSLSRQGRREARIAYRIRAGRTRRAAPGTADASPWTTNPPRPRTALRGGPAGRPAAYPPTGDRTVRNAAARQESISVRARIAGAAIRATTFSTGVGPVESAQAVRRVRQRCIRSCADATSSAASMIGRAQSGFAPTKARTIEPAAARAAPSCHAASSRLATKPTTPAASLPGSARRARNAAPCPSATHREAPSACATSTSAKDRNGSSSRRARRSPP